MKNVFARSILALTLMATSIFASAQSPNQADPWQVLNKITHKRSYQIETHDRKCKWGTITGVTPDHLTARIYSPNPSKSPGVVTFARTDVLRVSGGGARYYNGRSSWLDVSSLHVKGRERLKIVTISGKTYNVKQPYTVSDEGITLPISGRATKIPKTEIARVYDVVEKPFTDTGEYLVGELGPLIIFDPYFYEYLLHLERYVSVPLYNASDPEDNSPAQCAK